jgi:L-asparaginase II
MHQSWDLRTYVRPDHPLQRRILGLIAEMTGIPQHSVHVGIDGCGVPSFGVPLISIATAFARLVTLSGTDTHGAAAVQVRSSMLAHPEMVAGEGRFDTDLMVLTEGRILAKGGAEACYGAAIVQEGLGIALKIEDGGGRAVAPGVVAALHQIGALSDREADTLGEHGRPIVRNYRDEIVGEGYASFTLH